MSLSSPRAWIAGTVVASLVLVAAGWFLLIAPKRAEAADLRAETVAAQGRNAQLETRIAELKEQFALLPQRKAELAAVRTAMPQEAELSTLTRDLQTLANQAGVVVMTITPGEVTPLTVSGAVVAAAPAEAADAAAEGAAPAEGTDTAAGTEAAAAPVATVATAPAGLTQVPVTVSVVGSFDKANAFLQKVQEVLGRDYLVDTLNVLAEEPAAADNGKPAVVNGDVTMTLTGRVFVLAEDATSGTAASGVPGTSNN